MLKTGCQITKAVSLLCSLGLFLAGYIFYSSSLIESFYAAEFGLGSWQIGIAQSAVPLGAILGAVLAGRLSDLFGRHRLLVWNFLLLVISGISSGFVTDFDSLCLARTLNGFLAGTLYPLCAAYLTEMTPQTSLARQSAILMFINCMAAPVGCIVAIFLSLVTNDHVLWRALSMFHAIPSFVAYLWSKKLPESSAWLLYEQNISRSAQEYKKSWKNITGGLRILFNQHYRRITICLMASWFLMDVAYYGINFFVPYLLQVTQVNAITASFGSHSLLSNATVWGTLIINIFFMLGAFAAIFVVERINLVVLQKYGFLLASVSLFMLALCFYMGKSQAYIIVMLFVMFNFALNVGPDVTTYLLPATSYPVDIRGSGHGFIAGFAKSGSFLGVLFLPRMQDLWGYETVIIILSLLLFAAYLFTINFGRTIVKNSRLEDGVIYETY